MIIITGLRSGTSLMMQTLKLLGFPIVGFMFHDDFSHRELNSKGYWDLPMNETIKGLNSNIYKGKAVKLGGGQLYRTNPKYVSKVIWCRRNPDETKKSIQKLLKADYNIAKIEPTLENAKTVYDFNLALGHTYIEKANIPHIIIYYEEMLLDTVETIKKIKEYLGTKKNINDAVLNVDKREVLWQLQQQL